MMEIVVCDTSALIRLRKGDLLACLNQLFPTVYIPTAVAQECRDKATRAAINQLGCFQVVMVHHLLPVGLGSGEREAISLTAELGPKAVLLTDDEKAINKAKQQGLIALRTTNIIILAKWAGLIPSAKVVLDRMRSTGEGIPNDVYQKILQDTGED